MPSALVDSVAEKVDDLSKEKAEEIYNEVKDALIREDEIPDNNDDMSEEDWGLLTDSFLTTISARFDVDRDDLTDVESESFLRNNLSVDQLLENYGYTI